MDKKMLGITYLIAIGFNLMIVITNGNFESLTQIISYMGMGTAGFIGGLLLSIWS